MSDDEIREYEAAECARRRRPPRPHDRGVARRAWNGRPSSPAPGYIALTGRAGEARDMLGLFARTAAVSGASLEDVAATAATLSNNLGIRDVAEMERALSGIYSQGKSGAVELKNMATILAGVTPQFAGFGVTGAEGIAELGALLQVARQGFGSAEEAATGLRAVMAGLTDAAVLRLHVRRHGGDQVGDVAAHLGETLGERRAFARHRGVRALRVDRIRAHPEPPASLLPVGRVDLGASLPGVLLRALLGVDAP
jgi:hypothetical protein